MLTSRISIFTPILVLLAAFPANSQASPQRDPQAIAVLAQSLAANAGPAASFQDSVAEGMIAWPDGSSSTIRLKTSGPDRLRTEVTTNGVESVSVVRNGRGHAARQGTRRSLPPWATAYQRATHIPALSRLGDFARAQMNVVYVGLEDVNGQPAHHIRLFASPSDKNTPPEIEEMISDFHLFIDARSLLIVKTLSYDFSPDAIENRTLVETYFEDYRSVGGLAVPHRIARFVHGQRQMEISLTSVRLNVGLPESDFQ